MTRRGRVVHGAAMMTVVAIIGTTGACSTSRDTEQVAATDYPKNTVVPSTSVVVGSVPTTTSVPGLELTSVSTTQDTLTSLLGQFASNPSLVNQIAGLASGGAPDLAAIAQLVGIDPSAIAGLGLTVEQISSLGQTVSGSPDLIKSQLAAIAPGIGLDPSVLIGLLTSSLDMDSLANGAIGALVQVLLRAVTGIKIEVTPQLTIQLSELMDNLDPDGLGNFAADPSNASLLALITSAVISANPLLTTQLLANPLLDPSLKDLLVQLQALSTNLSDVAKAALLLAISKVFPGLIPEGSIPGN